MWMASNVASIGALFAVVSPRRRRRGIREHLAYCRRASGVWPELFECLDIDAPVERFRGSSSFAELSTAVRSRSAAMVAIVEGVARMREQLTAVEAARAFGVSKCG